MKLIFLDIDGVLNLFPKEEHELITEQKFDKECVAQLLRIIEETGAFVIMSSSWRYVPELLESSRKQTGLEFFYKTGSRRERHLEIMECVNDEGMNLESWVAIDDDIGDMIPIKKLGRLVRTKLSTGLTPELADKAIEILNQSRR